MEIVRNLRSGLHAQMLDRRCRRECTCMKFRTGPYRKVRRTLRLAHGGKERDARRDAEYRRTKSGEGWDSGGSCRSKSFG